MTDEPDSIVLRFLRRTNEKLYRLIDHVGDLKTRMTFVVDDLAGVNRRLDRLESRNDRIERRLDLVSGPGPKAAE